VQSFNDKQLSTLGRVHSGQEARGAIAMAQRAGFKRLNVDLIFGLPEQRVQQALADLTLALDLGIDHLSWYQLTIERNTAFWSAPPSLPASDVIDQMQRQAEHLLNKHGLKQYEISAWSSDGEASVHNLNYWRFGDYLAIGAGAHGKVTNSSGAHRFKRTRMPQHYLEQFAAPVENAIPPIFHRVPDADIPSEFMMNALRLKNGVETPLYEAMTGLPLLTIASQWQALQRKGLMISRRDRLATTQTGYRFLDDVIEAFV
jgi:oxygen-independent coproporphyrinogen-3 oxidase